MPYIAWHARDLDSLRREAREQDLDPRVDEWYAAMKDHVAAATRENYRRAVRLLIPVGKPFPHTALTTARLSQWMATMDGRAGTKHHRWSGMRRFIDWLIERSVLTANPANGVKRPKLPAARLHHLSKDEAIRLADAQDSPFREFSALLHGTGADVSAALNIRRRDVDVDNREIRVRGTKRDTRDRQVRVATWAWPYVEALLPGRRPDDLLFDAAVIDRFKQWHKHQAAVNALVAAGCHVYRGYTPRDARHTFAVRAVRVGTPVEIIAQQLGHKDGTMVTKVYGRFAPKQEERDRWEQRAAAADTDGA